MTSVAVPRSVAARITVRAFANTQRVIPAAGSIMAALLFADVPVAHGAAEQIAFVVAPFLGMGVLALAVDPQFDDLGSYLLNRVATAMCLVGAVKGRVLNGAFWTIAAYLVAQLGVVPGDDRRRLLEQRAARVDVSGTELLDDHVPSATRDAVVGAARAALDNGVKHAGTDRAELVMGIRNGVLTLLVVDDGHGFAATTTTADRLGVRISIEQRI